MLARSRPASIASTIALRLLPRPEIRTARGTGLFSTERGGQVPDVSAQRHAGCEARSPMPRRPRSSLPVSFFHVINRGVRKLPIFTRPAEYRAFLERARGWFGTVPCSPFVGTACSRITGTWSSTLGPPLPFPGSSSGYQLPMRFAGITGTRRSDREHSIRDDSARSRLRMARNSSASAVTWNEMPSAPHSFAAHRIGRGAASRNGCASTPVCLLRLLRFSPLRPGPTM